ncbi:DUF5320 family protein [Desulfovibrio sp. UCD-KL4C]|uniref:DUF5320 family protein n=1 Tax=Desulfovibrio sp. UCD-KL4C TaxID=2578120 RepID=UPI0025C48B73|nr:DUF5320 family protein [Desulfovibrio sp. UCD-KL4C]
MPEINRNQNGSNSSGQGRGPCKAGNRQGQSGGRGLGQGQGMGQGRGMGRGLRDGSCRNINQTNQEAAQQTDTNLEKRIAELEAENERLKAAQEK